MHLPASSRLAQVQGPKAPATPPECQELSTQHGKPLWTSEGWNLGQVNDWTVRRTKSTRCNNPSELGGRGAQGAMNLALTINQNYAMERQTAMIVWTVIYAWCKPHGLRLLPGEFCR